MMKRQHWGGCHRHWIQQVSMCFLTKTLQILLNAYWSVENKSMSTPGRKSELSGLFYLLYQEPETSITRPLAPKIIRYSKVERLINNAIKEIFNKSGFAVIPSTCNILILWYYYSIKMFHRSTIYIRLITNALLVIQGVSKTWI